MTDFIVISDISLYEFVVLSKNKIKTNDKNQATDKAISNMSQHLESSDVYICICIESGGDARADELPFKRRIFISGVVPLYTSLCSRVVSAVARARV